MKTTPHYIKLETHYMSLYVSARIMHRAYLARLFKKLMDKAHGLVQQSMGDK